MKQFRIFKAIKIVAMIAIAIVAFGYLTMSLWNWLMPSIFGLRAITFEQALGLFVLAKLLFGGFHRHGGGGRQEWKRHMKDRWESMSEEERERFRAGMRGRRWGCGPFDRSPDRSPDRTPETPAAR